jgi:ketosteroid isomerase-like protein
MSEPPQTATGVELVDAAIAAFNARDWDRLGDLLSSDIEVRPATALFAPSVRGWPAVRAFWQDLAATMQGARLAVVRLETARGRVLAAMELSSSGPASGITLQQRYFSVVTVRDGKITRLEHFMEEDDAREAFRLADA